MSIRQKENEGHTLDEKKFSVIFHDLIPRMWEVFPLNSSIIWPTNVTTRSTGSSYILLPQKFSPTYVEKLRKQGPLVHTITSNTSDTETYTF